MATNGCVLRALGCRVGSSSVHAMLTRLQQRRVVGVPRRAGLAAARHKYVVLPALPRLLCSAGSSATSPSAVARFSRWWADGWLGRTGGVCVSHTCWYLHSGLSAFGPPSAAFTPPAFPALTSCTAVLCAAGHQPRGGQVPVARGAHLWGFYSAGASGQSVQCQGNSGPPASRAGPEHGFNALALPLYSLPQMCDGDELAAVPESSDRLQQQRELGHCLLPRLER